MVDGFAWPVSSEISTGSKSPRELCAAVLRPDVFVKRPSFSIPAGWAILFMILPKPSLFKASRSYTTRCLWDCQFSWLEEKFPHTGWPMADAGLPRQVGISLTTVIAKYLVVIFSSDLGRIILSRSCLRGPFCVLKVTTMVVELIYRALFLSSSHPEHSYVVPPD